MLLAASTNGLPPTVEDARRLGAIAGADPRVEQVIVFGSVGRGDASEWSDIDLVVLLGDIPKDERRKARSAISSAMRRESSWPLDLVVLPRLDFEHSVRHVTPSFEHYLMSDGGVVVYQSSDPLPPATGTLQRVARDNLALAVQQMESAKQSVLPLVRTINNIPADEERFASSDSLLLAEERANRYMTLLQHAHMVIEQSFRATASAVDGRSLGSGHQIDEYLARMGDTPERAALKAAVEPLRGEEGAELQSWRLASYAGHLEEWADRITAENASAHIDAAVACTRKAAEKIKTGLAARGSPMDKIRSIEHSILLLEQTPHTPAELTTGPATPQ
ncbi:MAG: nucleotidyltransferase domain-containing protein [bacterium]|nr:nucleotidyltransferase domain-containing protein [bacterium]MCY4193904.1 nucleotidyltransferase domain-containing protein [bacterium]MCY4273661.1 nucleotidyltransferase domain-containing protein [bacterium]